MDRRSLRCADSAFVVSIGPEERESDVRPTPFTGSIVIGPRVALFTIREDEERAYVTLQHAAGVAVPITGSEVCWSQRAAVNAAKDSGSVNLRHGSFALSGLGTLGQDRNDHRYDGIVDFVRRSNVGRDVPENVKDELIRKLSVQYGLDQ